MVLLSALRTKPNKNNQKQTKHKINQKPKQKQNISTSILDYFSKSPTPPNLPPPVHHSFSFSPFFDMAGSIKLGLKPRIPSRKLRGKASNKHHRSGNRILSSARVGVPEVLFDNFECH